MQRLIEEGALASRTTDEDSSRAAPGRPRSSEIDELILSAARSLLADGGYEAMTFEAIGKVTGIGRPTIYRRWPSKAHLAAAITYGKYDSEMPTDRTSLKGQIAALVDQVAAQYANPEIASASVGLINAFFYDKALRDELHTPAEINARRQLRAMVEKGKADGIINPDADGDMLFDMLVGTLIYRSMFSSTEKPADHSIKLTEALCRALAPPSS